MNVPTTTSATRQETGLPPSPSTSVTGHRPSLSTCVRRLVSLPVLISATEKFSREMIALSTASDPPEMERSGSRLPCDQQVGNSESERNSLVRTVCSVSRHLMHIAPHITDKKTSRPRQCIQYRCGMHIRARRHQSDFQRVQHLALEFSDSTLPCSSPVHV